MKETLSNIILFCGGANVRFLRENCPNERHKFYPIGLGVIITALLGFISMMFATHSIFEANSFGEEIVLILFSLFWAFAIFTIDWGLVKTMRKSKNEDPTTGDKIRAAVPIIFRLLVALILSFSISRPMEVKIYEKRLKAQIETDRQAYVDREWDLKNEKIKGLTADLNKINATDTLLMNQKEKGSQSYTFKQKLQSDSLCKAELKVLRANNDARIIELKGEVSKIQNSPSSYYNDSTGIHMYLVKKNRIGSINNSLIPELNKQIERKQNECIGLFNEVATEDSIFKLGYDKIIAINSGSKEEIAEKKKNRHLEDSLALQEIKRASYVSFDTLHPGLITQLESMSNFEKTPEGKSAGWVRLILLLVIICIDTAPIVIKLLTKRGVYESMQDADEERMQFLTKQEGYSNNHLITQLSLAQKEILTEAVKRWRNKEKNRDGMENDYVNSNQQDNGNENS